MVRQITTQTGHFQDIFLCQHAVFMLPWQRRPRRFVAFVPGVSPWLSLDSD
jgi:hypothetical protein